MAGNSIDNLQIKINSSAESAVNQIDDLVKKLGKLTKALDQATVDPSIASGLDLIAKSAKKFNDSFGNISAEHVKAVGTSFKDLAAGINNVNKAINGVDFMKLANQASQLDTALDKKLNETLDEFGIKGKKNINLVKESFYGLMSELKSGNLEGALSSNVSGKALQALKDNARFAIEPSEDVREAQRLINAVKKAGTGGVGIDSRQASEVAQIKESMTKYANVFSTTGNANQGINEFIAQNKLLVQTGLNEADTFRNLAQAINRAMATLKNAENSTIGYDQAIKQLGMDENYAAQAINGIIDEYVRVSASQERAAQTQRQNAESMRSVSGLYKQFAQGLREVAAVDIPAGRATGIAELAYAVSQFGYAKIKTATQIIPALTKEINNMLTVLSKSPAVSVNITRLILALSKLASNGRTLKVATNAIANGMNKTGNSARQATPRVTMFGNALKTIHGQSVNVLSSLRRLAGVFGTVYASLFMFVGAFHKIKEAIGYAADLTEIQNVVDVTFGNAASKIDEFTQTSIKDFGLNELSVKQFASRYQSMGVAMGITNEQVKNAHEYLSQFRTPTGAINGYNEMSNSMADMSLNLTKLTGDLASFYDQNQEDVAQALQSGIFAGQTRPLRQYGVDLTQATLQEWALSQGINANIASMTQAEKTMLRYEYTMQRLGMAQGDFVRTQHTWANQVRVLKQQFQALGAVIGQGLIQALKPALIAFNAFLSRVIEFAKQVLNALGKIFGWKVDISGGGLDTDLSEAEDAATGLGDALGGAGDNAGDAADKVKELKKQLQGFDKLNVLTTDETGSGSGGSGGGGGGSGGSGGGGGAGSSNDLAVNLQKTEGLFESSIDNLFELGQYISETLQNAMDNIDWNSIYEKARGFGSGLASFLNGLFSGSGEHNVFASLGRTVAGAINTALNFFDSFADVFDFSTFGRNLASFFVETVENIDWTMAGQAFHKWMQGIKDAFTSFVSYLWENKDEVWKAIKDFFSEVTIEDIAIAVGTIALTKVTKWLVFGQGATTLAAGLAKWIGTIAIEKIGISIGAFTAEAAGGLSAGAAFGEIIKTIGTYIGVEVLEMGVAGTLGFALPIAALVALSVISWKVSEKEYQEYEDANAAVRRLLTAGVDGEELKTTVSWQVKHKLDTKNQGAFVNDTFGSMFTDYHLDSDGNLRYDMNGFVNIGWGTGKRWQSLKDWLKEQWSNITGGLGGGKWGETFSSIKHQFSLSSDVVNFPWKDKGFFKWLFEKLFPKTVKTTDGQNLEINYSVGVDFGLDDKFGNGKFKTWLEEKLGISKNKDTVTATTGLTKGRTWDSGKKEYNSVHNETATKTIAGSTAQSYTQRKNDYNGFKSNTATKTIAGSTAKTYTNAKNDYNGFKSNTATKTAAGSVAKSFWDARSYFNGVYTNTAWKDIKGSIYQSFWDARWYYNNLTSKTITVGIKGVLSSMGSGVKSFVTTLANVIRNNAMGGILTASGWQPIQGYATGGMPSSAEVFMARENGLPEMVGRIGNHTAVMNNDQIVSSVAAGVASAVSGQNELLIQQNSLLRQILAKETGISSRDVFNAVRSENNNYINRTGTSAFA